MPAEMAEKARTFSQPYYNQWVSRTETATHTYNFCISPLTQGQRSLSRYTGEGLDEELFIPAAGAAFHD
jgi:hypothetical protein